MNSISVSRVLTSSLPALGKCLHTINPVSRVFCFVFCCCHKSHEVDVSLRALPPGIWRTWCCSWLLCRRPWRSPHSVDAREDLISVSVPRTSEKTNGRATHRLSVLHVFRELDLEEHGAKSRFYPFDGAYLTRKQHGVRHALRGFLQIQVKHGFLVNDHPL